MLPIAEAAQDADPSIRQRVRDNPTISLRHFGDIELAIYTPPNASEETPWKIILTDDVVEETIVWFHHVLGYPQKQRLKEGMRLFYHPRLNKLIDNYSSDAAQRYKSDGRGYGHLPARQVRGVPWQQVDVDLIGPWTVQTGTGRVYEFNALTCIDRVTGLPELIRIDNKTAAHVASKFEECWLARYPRPEICCHDGGGEFKGAFGQLLYDFGISDASTTAYNPQANSICERMHREVGNILRCLIHSSPPRTLADAKAQVDSALATTMHVLRTNVSQSTGNSPGALAFHRDMIMNIPLQADLRAIRARRQLRVDDDLRCANARRNDFDYQPGQQVLVKQHKFTKLREHWDGPFQVLRLHVNGNLTLQVAPGITRRLNIRRLKPYFQEGFGAS